MTTTPPIAILGAGPSGLILGRLLELANVDYIIFERDEAATSIGQSGTLDIHVGSGQVALKEAGLLEQFHTLARGDVVVTFADAAGKVWMKFGEEGTDIGRPEIDRKDLRAMLLNSVPAHKIQWDSRIQRVQKESDGLMSVHLADGNTKLGFRLVVAADGAWSKARSLVTSARPQFSGLYYLTSSIKPGNPFHASVTSLVGQGNYLSFGKEKQIAAQLLGDGSYYVAIGLRLPENWSSENASLLKTAPALKELLLQDYFSDWAQTNTDLIKHTDGDFRAWPLYAMPTDSLSWQTVPGITLLGDAAHLTTPFVGEGVNCAMYDSVQLAQQIVKYGLEGLDQAVSEYEKLMFPRAIDLIERSAQSGELLYAQDAPHSWLQSFAGIYTA